MAVPMHFRTGLWVPDYRGHDGGAIPLCRRKVWRLAGAPETLAGIGRHKCTTVLDDVTCERCRQLLADDVSVMLAR